MTPLGRLLGQDVLCDDLITALGEPGCMAARLTGPSGSGKTEIACAVASRWLEQGGTCVVAVGDETFAWRDLYPLLIGLSTSRADWGSVATSGTRSALRIADSALGPAGVGTSIFDLLTAAFRQRLERSLRPLSPAERDIVLDLRRISRRGEVLLIAENAHWWDAASIGLLRTLLSRPLRQAIPRLATLRILIVDAADDQRVLQPEAFRLLAATSHTTITARRASRTQIGSVMAELGVHDVIDTETVAAIYSATDGHLKALEQLAGYLQQPGHEPALLVGASDFMGELMSTRLLGLGSASPDFLDLLAGAAVLGLQFHEMDLLCISGASRSRLRLMLDRAEASGLVARHMEHLAFSHDLIRAAILRRQAPEQLLERHARLAECIAKLRPGDYAARAQAYRDADDHERSRDMVALAGVDQLRRGVSADEVMARVQLMMPNDDALQRFLTVIAEGYHCIAQGDFHTALARLRTSGIGESTLMAAERNYLLAICLMEQQSAAEAADARAMLVSWSESIAQEPELAVRFLLARQQSEVLAELFDDARSTERSIEQSLLARARFDVRAASLLQIQNRRAAAVNVPEVAEPRIEEAVAYFARGTGDLGADQLERFRSLTNLGAVQLRLGKHSHALETCQRAERVALDTPEYVRRLDVLASNLVLASLRCGSIDASEAVAKQRLILESHEGADDKFIHRCNLAAYLLLDAQDDEAESMLGGLLDELDSAGLDESYLVYYGSALSVASAALRGDEPLALSRHDQMAQLVATIRWPCAPYLRRRQVLLPEVLRSVGPTSDRKQLDEAMIARGAQVGPAWTYYGRLIPACELSFWSDS